MYKNDLSVYYWTIMKRKREYRWEFTRWCVIAPMTTHLFLKSIQTIYESTNSSMIIKLHHGRMFTYFHMKKKHSRFNAHRHFTSQTANDINCMVRYKSNWRSSIPLKCDTEKINIKAALISIKLDLLFQHIGEQKTHCKTLYVITRLNRCICFLSFTFYFSFVFHFISFVSEWNQ